MRFAAFAAALPLLVTAPLLRAQVVAGRLVDAGTRAPIAAGSIELLDSTDAAVATASTDTAGAFRFDGPGEGSYRLRATSDGYRGATSSSLDLSGTDTVDVEFRISRRVILLDPLVVGAPARRHNAYLQGFYDRMANMPVGRFLTREDVLAHHSVRTSDLLRLVPGVQLVPDQWGHEHVLFRGCAPKLFIDGIQVHLTPMETVDGLVFPDEIEGVEIYRDISETPAEFSGLGSQCGALAIWTRRG
ncbi:MAG TPA: TonB-dependent receptor [Longimicrobiaceae bacterium]|nr:TonB-dependent receptor [Longimicrobiaceae bacterium]